MSFSWASGITTAGDQPYQNGRNQESTSEAVNAYYAMQLFGSAVHGHANNSSLETIPAEWRDTDVRQAVTGSAQAVHEFGRVLLAMEVDGADTYWHQIPGDQAVYKTYNKSVVGIVWTHLVQVGVIIRLLFIATLLCTVPHYYVQCHTIMYSATLLCIVPYCGQSLTGGCCALQFGTWFGAAPYEVSHLDLMNA